MTQPTPKHRSLLTRLFTAAIAAALTLALATMPLHVVAQQQPPAKKADAKKEKKEKEKDEDAPPEVPPRREIADDEWLSIEPFDVLVMAAAEFRTDKTVEIEIEPLDERPLPLKPREPGDVLEPKIRIRLSANAELYEVLRSRIVQVKHFEDLLLEQGEKHLRQASQNIAEGQAELNLAFDLFSRVRSIAPDWPGLGEKLVGFWYAEARHWITQGGAEDVRGVNILHEMRQYCKANNIREHEQTRTDLGRAVDRIVERAFENKDYVRARNYLFILEEDYADHDVVKKWRQRFTRRAPGYNFPGAEDLVKEAKEKEAAGQAREACLRILQAADMWPSLPGLKGDFDRIYQNYPILHVAVRELPDRFAPWAPPGSGDARVAQLLYVPLMEVTGVGENTKFSSRIFDYEITELGRQLTLRVKPGRLWSDGEKPITAMDVARSISARCDPDVPSYDATLKSLLKGVAVPSINEAVVELKRTQLPGRELSNFLFNVAPGHRLLGDRLTGSGAVAAGPFRGVSKKTGVEAVLQANEHFFGGRPKIAEIVERRYAGKDASGRDATGKLMVNALLSGDVALVEHVPAKQLRRIESRIAARNDLTISRGTVLALHTIAFDFRRPEFAQSRTLRRAVAYAIDRRMILENALLESAGLDPLQAQRQQAEDSLKQLDERKAELPPQDFAIEQRRLLAERTAIDEALRLLDENTLADGPFPKDSYAFDSSFEPWYFDPVLAKALAEACKKELKTQSLRFTLQHPDVEEAREACRFLQAYWKNVGIEVELRARPTQELEEDVALGKRFDLVYRIHYVRDPVLDAARVLCLGPPVSRNGEAFPNCGSPWLRQNLRELELATNWPIAKEKLKLVQHWARYDVAIIPLWQLTDYYAYHQRVHGFPEKPLGFYQDAAGWQIDPWYRQDQKNN
jgi:ABC-type transport system substrate-binding protein